MPKRRKKSPVTEEVNAPEFVSIATSGFANRVEEADDYPMTAEARFFTKGYEITLEDKKRLKKLSSLEEFRTFEKYIDWRINACAKRMQECVMLDKRHEAALEASAIASLAKITKDMKAFWLEVEAMDLAKDVSKKEIDIDGIDEILLSSQHEAKRF